VPTAVVSLGRRGEIANTGQSRIRIAESMLSLRRFSPPHSERA
jgi:hypothetical protein